MQKKKDFFTYKLFRQQKENKMWLMSCVNFFSPFIFLSRCALLLPPIALLSRRTRVVLGCLQKRKNYNFFFS